MFLLGYYNLKKVIEYVNINSKRNYNSSVQKISVVWSSDIWSYLIFGQFLDGSDFRVLKVI